MRIDYQRGWRADSRKSLSTKRDLWVQRMSIEL